MAFITFILYSLPQNKNQSHPYDGLTDPTQTSLVFLTSWHLSSPCVDEMYNYTLGEQMVLSTVLRTYCIPGMPE